MPELFAKCVQSLQLGHQNDNNCHGYSAFIVNDKHWGVCRIQSNIYDEAFLQKQLTAKSRLLFPQKSSIVDGRVGSKYVTGKHEHIQHIEEINLVSP